MQPLDDGAQPIAQLIQRALKNIDEYRKSWTPDGLRLLLDPGVDHVRQQCPPDRLYRLRGWGDDPLVYVAGYKPAERGVAAHCVVTPLGTDRTLGAPPEALQDVTDAARAGILPEQAPVADGS